MKTISTFKKSVAVFVSLLISSVLFAQTTHNVSVTSNVFSPKDLTINVGDKVIWTNTQGSHNVNGTKATFPSNPESFGNNVGSGWTYEYTFNTAGSYQYRCDPHVGLGMVGTVTVNPASTQNKLTVYFTGMTPHVGQTLHLAVINSTTMEELARTTATVAQSFSVEVMGIENGQSYYVDFFSDHNGNGMYDAPPTDHAWRMDLANVDGDETLNFAHNTTFTDIMWMNKLTVNFTGMTPHVGQTLHLAVINSATMKEVARTTATVAQNFSIEVFGIENGQSYHVDFFSDHNGNGMYDAPPTDHAWRMDLANVDGDEILNFAHNTTFTNIMWMNKLTVNFTGMTPHVGQTLHLAVINSTTMKEVARTTATVAQSFSVEVFGIENGQSYHVDFFSDHNSNGMYDAPPADHAWRMDLMNVDGDETLNFAHNTTFTNIMWMNKLTVNFTGMTPHVGQTLHLAVINSTTMKEVARTMATVAQSFSVEVFGIENGQSYHVDFFSDHNNNGMYDAPPADHAWRMDLADVDGDETLDFAHNTTFTDIAWMNKLTVHFMNMTPHVGQKLTLSVVNKSNSEVLGTVEATVAADFMVSVYGIVIGQSYNVDFYSDHNSNGSYDAPPTDHAWRLALDNVDGDEMLEFTHNTNFTDISIATSVDGLSDSDFNVYPNPATDYVYVSSGNPDGAVMKIFNIAGVIVKEQIVNESLLKLDVSSLESGLYIVAIQNGTTSFTSKFIKQ